MRIARVAALGVAGLAITAATLTGHQAAVAADFEVTANGVTSGGTIADLPASSTVQMAVTNLPANVGLYVFHCLVPSPGASPVPTRCDAGTGTLVYVMAAAQPQTTSRPIVINAEFVGKNPNPQTGDTGTTDVNCRVDTCAIYTLGAGRDSTNRAYTTFFPTEFAEVGPQAKDWATAVIRGQVIKGAWQPRVSNAKASEFTVKLKSGLRATLASDNCEVSQRGKIRALTTSGTCTVTISSPGNDEWAPYERELIFRLTK
jgi:hypothetical protein